MLLSRRYLLAASLSAITLMNSPVLKAGEKFDIVDTAVKAGSFKTLAAALDTADLIGVLKGKGPFTVFAPTDDAFAKLPQGTVESLLEPGSKRTLGNILKYHVVAGAVTSDQVVKISNATTLNGQRVDIAAKNGIVTVDGAKVVTVDIKCSNGIIHVIDSVILPSSKNIPAIADEAGQFKTLLAAAKATKLVAALSGDKPLTVFAPSDDAFARLPNGTVESLLKPENLDQLKQILLYHVVEGRVYSEQALKMDEAKTLGGKSIQISSRTGGAFINESKLTALDIEASNGVIHVIDRVLMPPKSKKVSQAATQKTIEHTINRGTAFYNAGNADACASLYMKSVAGLLSGEHQLSKSAHHHLTTAMTNAKATSCSTSRSWALRQGLDGAYRSLMVSVR
jgi:uncharacterized surface protein with fasciclin (FAS1) repeats